MKKKYENPNKKFKGTIIRLSIMLLLVSVLGTTILYCENDNGKKETQETELQRR